MRQRVLTEEYEVELIYVAARHKDDQGRVTNNRGVAMSLGSQIKGIFVIWVGHHLPGSCSGSRGEIMPQRTRQHIATPDAGTIGPRR
jgi:hypothetical protein